MIGSPALGPKARSVSETPEMEPAGTAPAPSLPPLWDTRGLLCARGEPAAGDTPGSGTVLLWGRFGCWSPARTGSGCARHPAYRPGSKQGLAQSLMSRGGFEQQEKCVWMAGMSVHLGWLELKALYLQR